MSDDLNLRALGRAAHEGRTADMNGLLDRGASVNTITDGFCGWTVLHQAVQSGHDGCVDSLVKRGANVNAQDKSKWTPLISAGYYGHPSIVQKLLTAGADPTLKTEDGKTALDLAKEGLREGLRLPLHHHTECIRWLENPAAARAQAALARAEVQRDEAEQARRRAEAQRDEAEQARRQEQQARQRAEREAAEKAAAEAKAEAEREAAEKAAAEAQRFSMLYGIVDKLEELGSPYDDWVGALQPRTIVNYAVVQQKLAELYDAENALMRFVCLSFLISYVVYTYLRLFLAYACLNVLLLHWPVATEQMDNINKRLNNFGGDAAFFLILLSTNLLYLFAKFCAPNFKFIRGIVGMLLETVNSGFNSIRIQHIIGQTNRERKIYLPELILETIFIEIAPVTLLARLLTHDDLFSSWDLVGSVTLLPLGYLLSVDFNHNILPMLRENAQRMPQREMSNGLIGSLVVLSIISKLWPWIIAIATAVAGVILAYYFYEN